MFDLAIQWLLYAVVGFAVLALLVVLYFVVETLFASSKDKTRD